MSVGRSTYGAGEPIDVSWSNAPGMGPDWISVFARPENRCEPNSDYLVYACTGSRIEGRGTIGPDSIGAEGAWPVRPGTYVVRLLPDGAVLSVAQSNS